MIDFVIVPKNPSSAEWEQICTAFRTSKNDVFVGFGTQEELLADSRTLQQLAYSDPSIGIAAGSLLKLFPDIPNTNGPRIYSCGRTILSPMGSGTNLSNLSFCDHYAATSVIERDSDSFWGRVFFIKQEVLQKIEGLDIRYVQPGVRLPPNIIWDDLALQVLQAGYKIRSTSAVVRLIEDVDVVHELNANPAYHGWEQKWGWHPIVPNPDVIRAKWKNTPIGTPLCERLLEEPWTSKQPPVDVIMLTVNNLTKLKRCLTSLGQTQYPSVKFHILLNGSSSAVVDYLEELKKSFPFPLEIIFCPANLGIPVALNWLHTRCTEPIISRLDDDIELPPNWLADMVSALRQYPFVGAVQPSMKYPPHQPGGEYETLAPLRLVGQPAGMANTMPTKPHQQTYRTNFLGGACVVFRKKAITLAGDYDIRYTPTQNEDLDYGLTLRKLGYDLLVLGKIVCIHNAVRPANYSYACLIGLGAQASYQKYKWTPQAREILEFILDRDGRVVDEG